MAKIKKLKKDDENDGSLESQYKDIIKKYGNVIISGSKLLESRKDYKTIHLSPIVDIALGGGIKEGSWVILSGKQKSGKTVSAMQLAYNCQKEGRPVIYINSEGRLKDMNFEIPGLDPEKMIIVTSENEPLSAEAFLEITHKLVSSKENEGCLCIIDSVSSLIPAKDLEEEVSGMIRPGLPKILSNFTKKMGQIVPNQRATMVMITHMITNTSGYGKHMNADSGVKIQYQADTNMEVKEVKAWMQGDTQVGQAVTWKILCSSMGPPGGECQSWIKYGQGIDKVQEIIIMGQEAGLISGSTWVTCDFLFSNPKLVKEMFNQVELNSEGTYVDPVNTIKLCKFQGQEKLYNFISSNPKVFELLESNIRELLS
jgi:recombination protein RecA